MGFRDYNPGLNRFTTRDMYNGALADMRLGSDPWNTNRYAFAGGNPVTGVELDGHIFDSQPTGGLMPHCVSYCGSYEERQATFETDDGDFGDWLGGVANSFSEAAADSTPLLKVLPGEHPARMLSDGANEALDADTSTGAYGRGHGAGDAAQVLALFLGLPGGLPGAAAKAPRAIDQTIAATKAARVPSGAHYSVAFEMKLDSAALGRSRSVHFNRANAALDEAIQSDAQFAQLMERLIPGVGQAVSRTGGRTTPKGWVWHHVASSQSGGQTGFMRLVPDTQHAPGSTWWGTLHPGGIGGYSEWAIPLGAPRN